MKKTIAAALFCGALVAGCGGGDDSNTTTTAPPAKSLAESEVVVMPQDFSDFALICLRGHLVIERTYDGGGGSYFRLIPNDPSCIGLDHAPPRKVAR